MLEITKICKSFNAFEELILDNFSLKVNKGEFCIILGSNGSGKSTLLKTISGEYKLDSGSVSLNKTDITKKQIYQRAKDISLVSQDIASGTVSELTVLENITLSLGRIKHYGFSKYTNRKTDIVDRIASLGLGLEKVVDKKMSELSGGQRQSIATLMALTPHPTLLLLDEHTSALDPKSKYKLLQFTANNIRKNNITTLMITHDIEDALKYGNRLIIMQYGKIVMDKSGEEKNKITSEEILDILHDNDDFADNKKEASS